MGVDMGQTHSHGALKVLFKARVDAQTTDDHLFQCYERQSNIPGGDRGGLSLGALEVAELKPPWYTASGGQTAQSCMYPRQTHLGACLEDPGYL